MRHRLLPLLLVILAISPTISLSAQAAGGQDARRAYATRAELEATLAEAAKVIASPGYSARLRDAKARESETIRTRLRDGDFQVGDQIVIQVTGEQQFTDSFTVAPGRMLTLPGMPAISLEGVLRYESEGFLTEQLKRVLRDPEVRIVPTIRLSVLGQVGRPGFYQFPADLVIADAIMRAGGPVGNATPGESTIRRGGSEIVSQEEFAAALEQGQTLDQLNLMAGDELVVDPRPQGRFSFRNITIVVAGISSMVYLVNRVF